MNAEVSEYDAEVNEKWQKIARHPRFNETQRYVTAWFTMCAVMLLRVVPNACKMISKSRLDHRFNGINALFVFVEGLPCLCKSTLAMQMQDTITVNFDSWKRQTIPPLYEWSAKIAHVVHKPWILNQIVECWAPVVLLAKGLNDDYSGEKMIFDCSAAPAKIVQMLENLALVTKDKKINRIVLMPPKDLQDPKKKKKVANAVFEVRCDLMEAGKKVPCTTLDKRETGKRIIDKWDVVPRGKFFTALRPHGDTIIEMPFDVPELVGDVVRFPSQAKVNKFITAIDGFSTWNVLTKRPKEHKP